MLRFQDVAVYVSGNAPVILCSHHDGQSETVLNGRAQLPVLRGRHSDEGTQWLTRLIANIMRKSKCESPHLLIFGVKLQRSTDEMLDLYIAKVFSVICECLDHFGKCTIVDIHRFYKHPELTCDISSQYDIWFGTDHRQSVRHDFDKKLAAAVIDIYQMCFSQKISIYVPGEKEKEGEKFGATGKSAGRKILTKEISDTFCGQPINAIQAEFYIDHLREGAPITKIAIAFANALLKVI